MKQKSFRAQAMICLRMLRRGTEHFEHVMGDLREYVEKGFGDFSLADLGTNEKELARFELNHRRDVVANLVKILRRGCSEPGHIVRAIRYQIQLSGKDLAFFGLSEERITALELNASQKKGGVNKP